MLSAVNSATFCIFNLDIIALALYNTETRCPTEGICQLTFLAVVRKSVLEFLAQH